MYEKKVEFYGVLHAGYPRGLRGLCEVNVHCFQAMYRVIQKKLPFEKMLSFFYNEENSKFFLVQRCTLKSDLVCKLRGAALNDLSLTETRVGNPKCKNDSNGNQSVRDSN
jgi:hypothetical protein